jgi:hypothetical protein
MSPKERFKASKELTNGFNDRIDSNQMQAAFDAAMLQMTAALGVANTPEQAVANCHRVEGAQMFLLALKTLNSDVDKPLRKPDGNLNHSV